MTDGSAWMAEGMRHAQLVGTLNVPYVCRAGLLDHVHLEIGREAGKTYRPRSTGVGSGHERGEHHHRRTRRADKLKHLHDASQEPTARIDPEALGQLAEKNAGRTKKRSTHHRVLYSDVAGARCDGYATSVTSTGAAAAANVSPKPIRNLSECSGSGPVLGKEGKKARQGEGRKNGPHVPRADEHADRVRRGLEDGRDAHDGRPEDHRRAPAEAVRHVWRERVRGEAPDVLWGGRGQDSGLPCRRYRSLCGFRLGRT